MQRQPLPMPGGAPLIPGFGDDPLAEREERPANGLIDPDEPTEGIRLLQ